MSPEAFRKSQEIQSGRYDAIHLSEDTSEPGIQRLKLNAYNEDAFRLVRAWKDELPLVAKVGPRDHVVFPRRIMNGTLKPILAV